MSDTHASNIQAIAKELARIIEDGDLDALRQVCTPDARIWHNTDQLEMTLEETIQYLQGMIGATSRRWFSDVRLTPTQNGFIHQHYTCALYEGGQEVRIPTCVIFTLEGERVKRLEEYFDASALGPIFAASQAG